MAKFPPPQNRSTHESAKREAQPHGRVFGMSRGQVSNLSVKPVAMRDTKRDMSPLPQRQSGFTFPSSYSGDAKPGGPRKPGVAFGAKKPWAEKA